MILIFRETFLDTFILVDSNRFVTLLNQFSDFMMKNKFFCDWEIFYLNNHNGKNESMKLFFA